MICGQQRSESSHGAPAHGAFRPAPRTHPRGHVPLKKRATFLGIMLGGVAAGAVVVGLATMPSGAPSAKVGARTDLHAGSANSALFHHEIVGVDSIQFRWFRYN